ncbi:MAG TPA: prolipoprotein diacylglyceryl transferase [Candidatus Acidoferrales bacterium]|nr:prolipoprotein diacylglyceryl transferase [Candidatus Acidoferrales bacterium]
MQHWFTYPNISPIAFHVGPLAVHWYGLSYLVGFLAVGAWMSRPQGRRRLGLTTDQIQDFLVYSLLGVMIGGRTFFVIADIVSRHNAADYFAHPLNFIAVWNGGMGFFGGLIGVIVAIAVFVKRHPGLRFLVMADEVVMMMPIGIALTRVVNFINDELWGDRCIPDHPWCILFPAKPDGYRYPSQLFEAAMDIAVLPILLLVYRRRPPDGVVAWTWFTLYGVTRSVAELWRQTDVAVGPFTGGQLLALPMIFIGLVGLTYSLRANRRTDERIVTA